MRGGGVNVNPPFRNFGICGNFFFYHNGNKFLPFFGIRGEGGQTIYEHFRNFFSVDVIP